MKKTTYALIICLMALQLQAQNSSMVHGIFIAPAGTNLVLQNSNAEILNLLTKKDTGIALPNSFKFSKPLANATKFNISIKSLSPGMVSKITNGQGTIPISENPVIVECDYKYDLISRSSKDATFSTFYESSLPAVAGGLNEEGRFVAFVSNSAKFCGATGKYRQLFLRDRNTGITKLISVGLNGEEGNGDSGAPSMAIDGHTIAFESYATNLVDGDKNGFKDVFIWDANSGKIQRISVGADGKEANGESFEPSLTTGEIAYTSSATNLVAGVDAGSMVNVYWRNVVTGEQKLLSVDYKTKKGAGGSRPSISIVAGDSTKVAFYSASPNLVKDDKNDFWDIFLYSKNKPLKRISMTYKKEERNQGNESSTRDVKPSISGNGRYVAFATTATNMVPDDKNGFQDIFVADTQKDTVVRVSIDPKGLEGNGDSPIGQGEKIAISYDGKWTAFNTMAKNLGAPDYNFFMHNNTTGETRAITTGKDGCLTTQPVMSINASYVVFGMCPKLDSRFMSSGIFAAYTGIAGTRFRDQQELNKK
jgi:Tol biopolymer transport system component